MIKKIYTLVLLSVITYSISASPRQLQLSQNITIDDGLAHNGVTSVIEDSKGYIWIGTYDGINRYDGYECKLFKNQFKDEIIVNNRIRCLHEDENGDIWIGTEDGISLYEYSKEKFRNIYSKNLIDDQKGGPIVRSIISNMRKDKILCLTEEAGILVFNSADEKPEHIFFPEIDGIQLKGGAQFVEIVDDVYVIISDEGLIKFNLKTGDFAQVLKDKVRTGQTIIKSKNNRMLVGSNGIDLLKYNQETGKIDYVGNYLSYIAIKNLNVDYKQQLWIGSLNDGVILINNIDELETEPNLVMKTYNTDKSVLRISSFCSTRQGGVWVGSFDAGIFKFNMQDNPFNIIQKDKYEGIQNKIARSIEALDADRFLVMTETQDVIVYNSKTNREEAVPVEIKKSMPSDVLGLKMDGNKNIWFRTATDYWLLPFPYGSKALKRLTYQGEPLLRWKIYRGLSSDKQGRVWLFTKQGAFRITLNSVYDVVKVESLKENKYLKDKPLNVRDVYVDPVYNWVWIGTTYDGLYRMKAQGNKELKRVEVERFVYNKYEEGCISGNFVTKILRLPNKELWVSTEGGGICKVVHNESKLTFVPYTEEHGLSNNVVKGFVYDNEHSLWIATNIGLNKLDTKEGKFRIFGKEDGLPFMAHYYQYKKLLNGNIVFSGVQGLYYFNPLATSYIERLPKFEFSELKLFNKKVNVGDTLNGRVVIDKRLDDKGEFVLHHNEDVFSIVLNSLHFSSVNNHYIKYKLEPVNDNWIQIPSYQRQLNYNGLRPGEYVLKVMASNSMGRWTEPHELKITIEPPFWKTWPAFIIYIVFVVLLIVVIMRFVLRLQSLQHKVEIEQLEQENVKNITAEKLRFFSNISHEIKTPLTLISGPLQMLINRYQSNDNIRENLILVQRQSRKISHLVDQVHDFQRSDANKLKMNKSVFCFDNLISELKEDFDFVANNENKKLSIKRNEEMTFVMADKDKLEKIMNNLISNCFKYTKENDSIEIEYHQQNGKLYIKVSDTGQGISTEDLPHIFERFFQSRNKDNQYTGGSGIGLAFTRKLVEMHYGEISAQSELGKGTTIFVELPVVEKEPDEDVVNKELEILSEEEKFKESNLILDGINQLDVAIEEEFLQIKVFLVEDNVDMRLFIESMLNKFFKVQTFKNGKECLEKLESDWPEIIVSDVLMPEVNGFDLCKSVKSDIKTSHIPVVLLTACSSVDDQIKGAKYGADAYIKKPFYIQHLVSVVESLLKSRKKLRQRFQIDLPLTLDGDSGQDNIFLEKLYRLMEDNLDNSDLDINFFAQELSLSRSNFYQKIKAITDETPYELLKMYRLKKAAELLGKPNVTVNEAYLTTGFKSRAHFSRLFKDTYGVTPSKYADKLKEEYRE